MRPRTSRRHCCSNDGSGRSVVVEEIAAAGIAAAGTPAGRAIEKTLDHGTPQRACATIALSGIA